MSNLKNLGSAGKKTARFLLAGTCDSYVPYVRCVDDDDDDDERMNFNVA